MTEKIPGYDLWSCGHVAQSMCGECYRLLAQRANELAQENQRLREQLVEAQMPYTEFRDRVLK
jgi:hypothetical protein